MEIKKMVSIRKSMDSSGLLREPFVVSSRYYTKSSCLGDMLFKLKLEYICPGEDSPIKVTKMLAVSLRGIGDEMAHFVSLRVFRVKSKHFCR